MCREKEERGKEAVTEHEKEIRSNVRVTYIVHKYVDEEVDGDWHPLDGRVLVHLCQGRAYQITARQSLDNVLESSSHAAN